MPEDPEYNTVTVDEFKDHILELAEDFHAADSDQELMDLTQHIVEDLLYFAHQVISLYEDFNDGDATLTRGNLEA